MCVCVCVCVRVFIHGRVPPTAEIHSEAVSSKIKGLQSTDHIKGNETELLHSTMPNGNPCIVVIYDKSCNSAFDDDDLITYPYTHQASRRPLPFYYLMEIHTRLLDNHYHFTT